MHQQKTTKQHKQVRIQGLKMWPSGMPSKKTSKSMLKKDVKKDTFLVSPTVSYSATSGWSLAPGNGVVRTSTKDALVVSETVGLRFLAAPFLVPFYGGIFAVNFEAESGVQMRMEGLKNPRVWIVGSLIVFAPIFLLIFLAFSGPQKDSQVTQKNAFIVSQGFIEDHLKSPATADFPLSDYASRKNADGSYTISSYVDSENDFGVPVRVRWEITVSYMGGNWADPENWKVLYLKIDDRVIK